jgi:GNAT superfamily N-acetyltransferase
LKLEGVNASTSSGLERHPLDDPVALSLNGAHRHLAVTRGDVMRYPKGVAPYMTVPVDGTDEDWGDLAQLAADDEVVIFDVGVHPPTSWKVAWQRDCLQMTGVDALADTGAEVVRLGTSDATEMLDLVKRTKPGPFGPRTLELGAYYGIRRDGDLIAMAGERLCPDGWTEVSAVCTDMMFRGQGLGAKLVSAVVAGIRGREESPFLHVLEQNQSVVDLYRRLGFAVRRNITIIGLRPTPDED